MLHTDVDETNIAPPRFWFGRGTAAVLSVVAACVVMFACAHSGDAASSRSRLLELGAIEYSRVEAGEHWRLLAAIFLHFDVGHLLANLSTLLIVGPPFAHQVGNARFVAVFLAGGVGANVISHVLWPVVGLKAGASGAIAAALGALCGLALRPPSRGAAAPSTRYRADDLAAATAADASDDDEDDTAWRPKREARRRTLRVLGALAGFYALMIGFGPGRDNVAHVAGVVLGAVLGTLIRPQPPPYAGPPAAVPEAPRPTR